MQFLKNLLASCLGTMLAMTIMVVVFFLVIVSALVGSATEEVAEIKDDSILHLVLDKPIMERSSSEVSPFDFSAVSGEDGLGLNQVLATIQRAKDDPKIKGIFFEPKNVAAAPSSLLDIFHALADFSTSGKWVVSYAENYTQGAYYLASAGGEVYMSPQGMFDWRGMNLEIMYYKKLMDQWLIDAQVVRGPNNTFKSAVEPYIYDHMTPENREQLGVLAEDMWRIMLDGISSRRNIPVDELDRYADTLEFVNTQRTIESNILDGLKYYDEILAILKTKKGLDVEDKDSKLNLVDFADYQASMAGGEALDELNDLKQSKVAVVYAVGAIESGEGDDQTIGSDRIAKALRDARLDDDVKAIVLRVNSPGGSALASDIIWRETELIKVSGKPFLVSMGDYAASGGYYIACNADRIYANPNTITGSIGVFGVIPNLKEFLDQKVGITFDRYETNPHADALSIFKPLDTLERSAMNAMISQIYDEFTSKVASGRHMLQSDVDSIARGRVWSGEDALSIGLVDELGDLDACIAAAAQKAGLTDYKRVDMPAMIDPLEKLIRDLKSNRSRAVLGMLLGTEFKRYGQMYNGLNMEGPQARLPFIMQVH